MGNHRISPPSAAARNGATTPAAPLWLGVAVLSLAALVWTYWQTIVPLWKDWQGSQEYSIGMIVPLAALYLLWQERRALKKCQFTPCWWGIGLILLGQAARAFGLLYLFESAERYSMVLTAAGAVLLIAGRQVFWRVRWILLFLFLMVPLPGRIHNLISGPLQTLATTGAVFLLEVIGVHVIRQGNTMVLNESTTIAVADACSGLRLLTAFIVVAAVLAYIVDRPRWQKVLLVLSSIPVAIACNIARLCVTAVLYSTTDSETAERFFHDFAGLTMMPLAVLILMAELALLKKLFVAEPQTAAPNNGNHSAGAKEKKVGKRKPGRA